jgi:Tfp pilus assembly protein PilV
VVASSLLLVSILPLLKTLMTVQAMDRAIQRKSWSLMLAQSELERIRSRCFGCYDRSYSASSVCLGGDYLCTVADDADDKLRTIAIRVGLDRDADGILSAEETEVRLSTRLARR